MISETMPLNEWPLEHLIALQSAIEFSYPSAESEIILSVISKAIKDVEFEQSKR